MEVILTKDSGKIGKAGQVIKVKDGFARNFLIPNGLALPLTAQNMKKLEQEKQAKAVQLEKTRKEQEGLKAKLEGLSLTMPVLTKEKEEDKIFGSVSAQEIFHALSEEGITIDKNSIVLDEPLKSLGIYEVPIKLGPEITAKLKVWIVKK